MLLAPFPVLKESLTGINPFQFPTETFQALVCSNVCLSVSFRVKVQFVRDLLQLTICTPSCSKHLAVCLFHRPGYGLTARFPVRLFVCLFLALQALVNSSYNSASLSGLSLFVCLFLALQALVDPGYNNASLSGLSLFVCSFSSGERALQASINPILNLDLSGLSCLFVCLLSERCSWHPSPF